MSTLIKLALLLGALVVIAFSFVLLCVQLISVAYLFPKIKAEQMTVWARVPEKEFDQKDYHIQYSENEHQLQKAGLKELYR